MNTPTTRWWEEKRIAAMREALKRNPPTKKPLIDRLYAKIERVTESGCWIWMGTVMKKGHGQISTQRPGKHANELAHRVSWKLHNGDIDDEICVLHRCDVGCCINPAHLFLGTVLDNNRDMYDKGRARHPTGDLNRAKTHCAHGHPFDEVNTYWWGRHRQCRACKQAYDDRKHRRARTHS